MAKISKEEYDKVKQAVAKNYTADSVKSYTDAYNQAKSSGSSTKDAYSSASGLLQKSTASSGGSGGTSSGGVSGNNTSGGDVYGDVSKKATTTNSMDFSNYSGNKKLADSDAVFGENAKAKEKGESGFLTRRNDSIASELYSLGTVGVEDVEKYLKRYNDFNAASQEDRDNTIRAISTRLSEIQRQNGMDTYTDKTTITGANGNKVTETTKTTEENPQKDGYYYDAQTGQYVKIYGYNDLDSEYRGLIDRMDEKERKYLSNMWASGMQDQVKTYLDAMRSKEQAEARQKNSQELYDINRAQSLIEAQQTLRHSQEQYDNLKQNWQYLGNMGMPGTSATKIQAIGDALKEAQTTLGEIQKLTKLKLDAQEKQWEGQVLQYNQQIDNLMYNLNWQVGSEVQAALSKFTTAELEGKLDTIDGVTAFRKELLDDLDANISGLTSASLQQMQYITQQYQDVADKMYEYQQNANSVNQEMSQVKGYYVDGNGNPIFNAKGETIEVPQQAPLDPIYDKNTGKLITFAYDENGNIVAQVQDILGFDNPYYATGGENRWDANAYMWKGANYNPVSRETAKSGILKMATSGKGGWCGEYVNKYLQSLGFAPSFIQDSLQSKLDIINTGDGYQPQIGDVVVFDYNHITPETGENNGHVGIVRGFKDGKMIVSDSNFKGDRMIKNREVSLNDSHIKGYFNPTLGINDYNNNVQQAYNKAQGLNASGYKDNDVANYNTYLSKGYKAFTDSDKEAIAQEYGSLENFRDAATAYQKNLDNQVSDVSIDMLKTLYNIKDNMTSGDYWQAKNVGDWASKIGLSSGGDWRTEIDHVIANETLEKLVNMKAQGATFGALSNEELMMLQSASNKLNYTSSYKKFMENIDAMIGSIEGSMDMRGYDYSKLKTSDNTQNSDGTTKQEPQGGHLSQ